MSQQFFEAIRAGDRGKVDALLDADATLLSATDEKGLGALIRIRRSAADPLLSPTDPAA